MTARNLYENVLIELNKENAPNILLEDFNYFVNKAVYQYTNKRYNIYDINQQTTDDLRVLKATTILTPRKCAAYGDIASIGRMMDATYEVVMPRDYFHILNCVCIYKVNKTYKCYNKGDVWRCSAKRLTSDAYSLILDNYWNRPTYKNPYYFIHNVNSPENAVNDPTDPRRTYSGNIEIGTDFKPGGLSSTYTNMEVGGVSMNLGTDAHGNNIYQVTEGNGVSTSMPVNNGTDQQISFVERTAQVRYGNSSGVRLEIRYGTDSSLFELSKVLIDYIKTPQHIRLTQEQIDLVEDHSQVLEFPDYVCQEIVNELVHIIMENIGDPKLNTHPVVSQSIANPAQQQTEPVAQPAA